jgi:hypothetical protein
VYGAWFITEFNSSGLSMRTAAEYFGKEPKSKIYADKYDVTDEQNEKIFQDILKYQKAKKKYSFKNALLSFLDGKWFDKIKKTEDAFFCTHAVIDILQKSKVSNFAKLKFDKEEEEPSSFFDLKSRRRKVVYSYKTKNITNFTNEQHTF